MPLTKALEYNWAIINSQLSIITIFSQHSVKILSANIRLNIGPTAQLHHSAKIQQFG